MHQYSSQYFKVNTLEETIDVDGKHLLLTKKEFELLKFFVENRNSTTSVDAVAHATFGGESTMFTDFNIIVSLIRSITKKLSAVGSNVVIAKVDDGYTLATITVK
jgi:DNA-binding response OmpR family regulator